MMLEHIAVCLRVVRTALTHIVPMIMVILSVRGFVAHLVKGVAEPELQTVMNESLSRSESRNKKKWLQLYG